MCLFFVRALSTLNVFEYEKFWFETKFKYYKNIFLFLKNINGDGYTKINTTFNRLTEAVVLR
jgi:hypothetical protein